MDIGLVIFLTGDGISPGVLAAAVEERGFESLFVTEHTHIPVAAGMVARDGSPMDPKYLRSHDPLVGLAFAAAATSKLILGTAVCLVNQHDTIALAKQVSSLDVLSGGRLVLGVGAGWNEPEMRNHGIDPGTRHGSMLERVQAMKAIWTQDEAEFHGRHVDFDPIWQWPKPLQEPHTPVFLGGNGPLVEDRVVRYGDGWLPSVREIDTLPSRIAALRERAGRHVPVTYVGATPATLDRLAAAGVDRALITLASGSEADVLASIPSL